MSLQKLLERNCFLAVVPVPWWETKLLTRPHRWWPKPRFLWSWSRNSDCPAFHTFFLQLFSEGRTWPFRKFGRFGKWKEVKTMKKPQNVATLLSVHFGNAFFLFFSWPHSNYLQRHLMNPKGMAHVWVSRRWVLEGTVQNRITFHELGIFFHGTIHFSREMRDSLAFTYRFFYRGATGGLGG